MNYPLFSDLEDQVRTDLDLQDVSDSALVTSDEMKTYFNFAIGIAEAKIHDLYEDYFLTETDLPMVTGQNEISFPSDIYGLKIRELVYSDGATVIYKVKRVPMKNKFSIVEYLRTAQAASLGSWRYSYIIKNASAGAGNKIYLLPAAQESSSSRLKLWYYRGANRYVDDTSVCDIPQWFEFVKSVVKYKCALKDKEDSQIAICEAEMAELASQMEQNLSTMVPDEDGEFSPDLDHYMEST